MVPQPAGALIALTTVLVIVAVVLVLRARARRAPRPGSDDRAERLRATDDGATVLEPPPGLTPGEAGALLVPAARYQHATATLLDLAARGHLQLRLDTLPPDHDRDTAWWTLAATRGRDGLRDHEQVLLAELGVLTGPARFPSLTNQSVERVHRRLRSAARAPRGCSEEVAAFQRGVARRPDEVDARWFAHAVALDVSPTLTRSLAARGVPTPRWATARGRTVMTWPLLDTLALRGAPFHPPSAPSGVYPGAYG